MLTPVENLEGLAASDALIEAAPCGETAVRKEKRQSAREKRVQSETLRYGRRLNGVLKNSGRRPPV